MKNKFWLVIFVVSLFFVSCASKPKPSPESATEPVAMPVPPPNGTEADPATAEALQSQQGMLEKLLGDASAKRQEIVNNEYDKAAPENFTIADGALSRARAAFDKQKNLSPNAETAAIQDAQQAVNGFNQILEGVWLTKVNGVRDAARKAQQTALTLKGDVAVRDNYNRAAEILNRGESSFKNKEWSAAFDLFVEAKPLFDTVSEIAAEKRNLAALALKNAESKIAESEKIAADAESIIQERARMEGEGL